MTVDPSLISRIVSVDVKHHIDLLTYDCRSNLAPKHARKHEAHPLLVYKKKKEKKEFRFDSNDFGFI